MAEHIPGTPYRYKHGWIKIESVSAKRVKDRKPLHNEVNESDMSDFQKELAHSLIDNWSLRVNNPVVAFARDKQNKIRGIVNYEDDKGLKALDIHDMNTKQFGGVGTGVGSALIQHIREQGATGSKKVRVYNALDSAIPFYEKTGARGFRDDAEVGSKVDPSRVMHSAAWPKLLADIQKDLSYPAPIEPLQPNPYGGEPTRPVEQYHEVQPPPQDDDVVRHIAEILLAGYVLSKTTRLIAALLRPYKITSRAIMPIVSLTSRGTKAIPNARPKAHGLKKASKKTRSVAREDVYYRAAYVLHASHRVQESINAKKPFRTTLTQETRYYRQHEKARRGRLDAAAKVQKSSEEFGPLLGWYLNPLLNNEIECITANGNNFYADEGTLIGLPGAVHQNCGCNPGPPHWGAGMVNEALKPILKYGKPSKFNLKIA